MANPVGRPPVFKTPQEMQKAIDKYFAECDPHVATYKFFETRTRKVKGKAQSYQRLRTVKKITEQIPYTMSGLSRSIGFENRQSLVDYKGKDDEFSDTIKNARAKVEQYVEILMLKSNGVVAGVIFNAKNNFGWKDKTEVDNTGEITHKYEDLNDEQLDQAIKTRQARVSTTSS